MLHLPNSRKVCMESCVMKLSFLMSVTRSFSPSSLTDDMVRKERRRRKKRGAFGLWVMTSGVSWGAWTVRKLTRREKACIAIMEPWELSHWCICAATDEPSSFSSDGEGNPKSQAKSNRVLDSVFCLILAEVSGKRDSKDSCQSWVVIRDMVCARLNLSKFTMRVSFILRLVFMRIVRERMLILTMRFGYLS